uniref:Putative c2h2-type zn-finger protein n=1 Tax=Culex tarsalis TaxID=7177 RepID=A0A1Q3EYD0_CULTA
MDGSSMPGRPKRNRSIRDYSLLFKRPPKLQKTKANASVPNGEPFTENATNADICVKNEPVYDETDANLPDGSSDEVVPLGEDLAIEIDPTSFGDAIVKDELIIEDVLEPLEVGEVEVVEEGPGQDTSDADEPIVATRKPKIKKAGLRRKVPKKRLKVKKPVRLGASKTTKVKKPTKTAKKLKKTKLAKVKVDVFMCAICNQTFSKNSAFTMHALHRHRPNFDPVVKKLKRYPCEICGKKWPTRKELAQHKQFHAKRRHGSLTITEPPEVVTLDEDGRIQCSECSKKLASREDYVGHYKWHMYLKQLNIGCKICGKLFEYKSNLQAHVRTHKGEQDVKVIKEENGTFRCSECMSIHATRMHCILHIRTHASNFRCATCGKFWESEEMLRKHEKNHEKTLANGTEIETDENGLFKCSVCPRRYTHRALCISHMRSLHGITQTKSRTESPTTTAPDGAETAEKVVMICPDCGKIYSNPNAFDQHCKRHQNVRDGRFRCKECGRNMSSKATLERHTLIHEHQRKFTNGKADAESLNCSECDKSFQTWKALARHVTWHQKSNKICIFTCKICGLAFLSQSTMLKHRLISHPGDDADESTVVTQLAIKDTDADGAGGVVVLKCPDCGEVCTNRNILRAHITRHNNIRIGKHQCKYCGRKHGTRTTLIKHELTHENNRTSRKDD